VFLKRCTLVLIFNSCWDELKNFFFCKQIGNVEQKRSNWKARLYFREEWVLR
jgi:hypothetical protein